MATLNPFDLLGNDDAEDPTQLLAAQQKIEKPAKVAPVQPAKPAKLPSKPIPPSQAVRESRNGGGRGGGRGFGSGRGRGGFNRDGYNRDVSNAENAGSNGFSGEGDAGKVSERRGGYGGPRGSFRGGRRDGFSNGDSGDVDRPRRPYERRSGTGRGSEFKRDGSGRGNWGAPSDEIPKETEESNVEVEKSVVAEKPSGDEEAVEANKEAVKDPEEKEPEDKEMTLEEYEKVLEEKKKALAALKNEERKVDLDKDLESMQQLSSKKSNTEIFIKLGSEKDKQRKDAADKEEKSKKSVSINEFLKPAEGSRPHYSGGRGRGRGRGSRGGFGGHTTSYNAPAPSIADPGHFPTLGGK